MRLLYLLFLVAFAGAVVIFAYQNQEEVHLRFFDWTLAASIALIIGVAYALGMLSGWTVVGMLRRSAKELIAGTKRQERAGV
jgi:uncharacterized integral membrane protein